MSRWRLQVVSKRLHLFTKSHGLEMWFIGGLSDSRLQDSFQLCSPELCTLFTFGITHILRLCVLVPRTYKLVAICDVIVVRVGRWSDRYLIIKKRELLRPKLILL